MYVCYAPLCVCARPYKPTQNHPVTRYPVTSQVLTPSILGGYTLKGGG
jgi:hypothetical protein